ncbi:MAG: DUF4907 domain-containing protein [Flavobacteriales bacterium]
MKPIKVGLLLLLFTAIFFYAVSLFVPAKVEVAQSDLTGEVINMEPGYGYQISLDGRVLIRQEFVPGAQGKNRFANPQEAKLIADLVISKLASGQSPEILPAELEELKIFIVKDTDF